jgi:beta-lactamase superfamily II metal-dependent hydrolase
LRTDRDGAVTVSTDGERVFVRTFRSGREIAR